MTDVSSDNVCIDCGEGQNVTSLSSATTYKAYDPLDESTFEPPPILPVPTVTIEFCDRCRWLHRASWVSTELLLTFPPPVLKGVHIVPRSSDESSGRFRVWLSQEKGQVLIYDRKIGGGFPELKELKQRIRDIVQPGKSLGHSDSSKGQ